MTRETYNKAEELVTEINRLELLTTLVNGYKEGESLSDSDSYFNDFKYTVELIGYGHSEDNYIIKTQVIDGVMCEDEVSIPMECCVEASTEDKRYFESVIDERPATSD